MYIHSTSYSITHGPGPSQLVGNFFFNTSSASFYKFVKVMNLTNNDLTNINIFTTILNRYIYNNIQLKIEDSLGLI
jgi:hypothetical protein